MFTGDMKVWDENHFLFNLDLFTSLDFVDSFLKVSCNYNAFLKLDNRHLKRNFR